MKSSLFALVGVALLASTTQAQDDSKVRKDHGYSTHNYKHANKAAAARQAEGDRGITVLAPATTNNQAANYKNQRPNQAPVGGVTVEHTLNERMANRNYKMQQPRLPEQTDAEMARKKDKPTKSGSASGEE